MVQQIRSITRVSVGSIHVKIGRVDPLESASNLDQVYAAWKLRGCESAMLKNACSDW